MKINKNDPRLSAYILGELSGPDKMFIERCLAEDPELQQFVADMRAVEGMIKEKFSAEPVNTLTKPQRDNIINAVTRPAGFRLSKRMFLTSGSLVAACLAYVILVQIFPENLRQAGQITKKIVSGRDQVVQLKPTLFSNQKRAEPADEKPDWVPQSETSVAKNEQPQAAAVPNAQPSNMEDKTYPAVVVVNKDFKGSEEKELGEEASGAGAGDSGPMEVAKSRSAKIDTFAAAPKSAGTLNVASAPSSINSYAMGKKVALSAEQNLDAIPEKKAEMANRPLDAKAKAAIGIQVLTEFTKSPKDIPDTQKKDLLDQLNLQFGDCAVNNLSRYTKNDGRLSLIVRRSQKADKFSVDIEVTENTYENTPFFECLSNVIKQAKWDSFFFREPKAFYQMSIRFVSK